MLKKMLAGISHLIFSQFFNDDLQSQKNNSLFVKALPFLFYILMVFLSTYILLSNSYFIEEELMRAEQKAEEFMDKYSAIELIERTREIIENPGYKFSVSIKGVFIAGRNLSIFLLLCFFIISLISEKWFDFKTFITISGQSVNILSLGYLLNALLKIALINGRVTLGIMLLLTDLNKDNVFESIVSKIDIFSLLFIISLSLIVARLYNEKKYFVFLIFLTIYILLIVVGVVTKSNFTFSY